MLFRPIWTVFRPQPIDFWFISSAIWRFVLQSSIRWLRSFRADRESENVRIHRETIFLLRKNAPSPTGPFSFEVGWNILIRKLVQFKRFCFNSLPHWSVRVNRAFPFKIPRIFRTEKLFFLRKNAFSPINTDIISALRLGFSPSVCPSPNRVPLRI
jgi:hypothetical protein